MAEGQYKSIHTGAEVDEAVSKVLNGEVGSKDAVLYTTQTLTEEQKAQARENIGAGTVEDVLAALPTWEGGSY